MIVVGLTGPVGHGKSSFADFLGSHASSHAHFESSDLIISVANQLRSEAGAAPSDYDLDSLNDWIRPLPDILAKIVHAKVNLTQIAIQARDITAHPERTAKLFAYMQLTHDKPDLTAQPINTENKTNLRSIQQWLGGYLYIKAGEGIWYDELVRQVEAERAKGTELTLVGGMRFPSDAERIRRCGGKIIKLLRPNLVEQDKTDLTEAQRHTIEVDSVVYNDSTLDKLRTCAGQVYGDLHAGKLRSEYHAATASRNL